MNPAAGTATQCVGGRPASAPNCSPPRRPATLWALTEPSPASSGSRAGAPGRGVLSAAR